MRPARDTRMLMTALAQAAGSTCLRRAVGCVLVDARGHILSTGFNGVAAGQPHCNEAVSQRRADSEPNEVMPSFYPNACPGATAPSGSNLVGCDASHAEQNAVTQCRDAFAIDTAYVTTAPCDPCVKLLLGTSCRRIVFLDPYAGTGDGADRWRRAGRTWEAGDAGAVRAGLASLAGAREAPRGGP